MHQLDLDTQLTQISSAEYETEITNNWSINKTPNGGYLMALLARAIGRQCPASRPLILTAGYMARCAFEPARVRVEKISGSQNFERLEARLIQQDEIKVLALATLKTANKDRPPQETIHESGPPKIDPIEKCIAVPPFEGYTLYRQIDLRLTAESFGWVTDDLSKRSEIKGWIRFHKQRPIDAMGVFLMADAFPPPVMASQGRVAWVPTIELSVSLRNLPQSQWLKGIFRTRHITADILEEDGELWDQTDTLVAVSRQIAQFRKSVK